MISTKNNQVVNHEDALRPLAGALAPLVAEILRTTTIARVAHTDVHAKLRRPLRESCAKGEGPAGAAKIGGRWYFTAAALEEWLAGHARLATKAAPANTNTDDMAAAFGAVPKAGAR